MTAVRNEQLSSPRILAGIPGDVWTVVYQDGAAVDVDASPTPTVTITDEAGNTVVSAGTATRDTTNHRLVYSLSGTENDRPKRLTATWSYTKGAATTLVTRHEAVAELLFTEVAARAFDGGALASSSTYPAATILLCRDQVHDEFEDIIGVAIGGRYEREVLDGSGRNVIRLERHYLSRLRSVATRASGGTTWAAYTAGELADVLVHPSGKLERETLGTFTAGSRNIAVEYEHGLSPIPLDLRQAAMRVARGYLVTSNLSDRAIAETNTLGTFSLATANFERSRWYGIPVVDATLNRYASMYRVPSI